jgi:hypothetical protein
MRSSDTVSPWELWILQGLDPTATEADVANLATARRRQDGWQAAIHDRLLAGDTTPLETGRRLLETRPDLASGLVITLHLGPYQFVLEPFLAAGLRLHVLVTADAARRLRPVADHLSTLLAHPGRLEWHVADDPATPRRLVRALRDDEPILAYADGNQGRDGLAGTRREGIAYDLPGRRIRVRTGLARFVSRTECPVHPVRVRWSDDGRAIRWRRRPTQRWSRHDDPAAITRRLYDWVFAEISAAPHQWSYWPMLGEAADCFAEVRAPGAVAAARADDDVRRTFAIAVARRPATTRLDLEAHLGLWPGGLLVDHTHDHFYAAAGLTAEDLALLDGRPTLASLLAVRGAAWVSDHVLRLCRLGLARLDATVTGRGS